MASTSTSASQPSEDTEKRFKIWSYFKKVEENEEVQRLDHGEDTFSINTTGLEEKATACQMV